MKLPAVCRYGWDIICYLGTFDQSDGVKHLNSTNQSNAPLLLSLIYIKSDHLDIVAYKNNLWFVTKTVTIHQHLSISF